MFEIGFSEMLVIAVVALVVLGPERLPRAARFVGAWVRRARQQWDSVKGELERELAAEDIKRNLAQTEKALREGQASLYKQAHEAEAAVKQTVSDAHAQIEQAAAPAKALATAEATHQDDKHDDSTA